MAYPKLATATFLHLGLISFLHLNWEGNQENPSENCLFHGNLIEYRVSCGSESMGRQTQQVNLRLNILKHNLHNGIIGYCHSL